MPGSQSSNPTKDERAALRTPDQESPAPRWRVLALPVVFVLVAGAMFFAKTGYYGLIGWDIYPLIATSRIFSLDDLVATFSEPLMAGRFPAHYYRPLVSLSFALDYALGSLRPMVYQLTNTVVFCGCAFLIWALASRLAGKGARWIAPIALLVFLLHPTHWEVIPVPARRGEMLCGLFIAWSLWAQLSPASLAMRRPAIRPALLCLLALASKETAIVLPGLAFLTVWLYSPRGSVLRRLVHALIGIVPHLVAVGIWIAVRLAVLGGLRGSRSLRLSKIDTEAPGRILETLLFPQPVTGVSPLWHWVAGVLAACLVLTIILRLFMRWRVNRSAALPRSRRVLSAAGVAAAMLVSFIGIYLIAGGHRAWYLFLPVMSLSLLVGAIGDELVTSLRRERGGVRVLSAASLLALTIILLGQARYSPLIHDYDEWDRATAASQVFFDELRTRIDQAEDGSIIEAPRMPGWVRPRDPSAGIRGGHTLADYSVQAWVDLVFPDRWVRILPPTRSNMYPLAEPDEVVVRLIGYQTDF